MSVPKSLDLDLSQLTDLNLLRQLGRIFKELHVRGICRTDSFVAEIGEWWAKRSLGLDLMPPVTPGYDAVKNGVKYEIKTRRIYKGARTQRSTRRVPGLAGVYDILLLVILDEFFQCREIHEIPKASIGDEKEATVAKLLSNSSSKRVWP